jgi:hypothetical protein
MAGRVTSIAAVVILAVAAIAVVTGATASPAKAACRLWALADKVDRQARVYGAGGVNAGCSNIYGYVDIDLYRDGRTPPVRHTRISCRRTPCAGSTGAVAMPRGSHSWCTFTRAYRFPVDTSPDLKTHCMVTNG